MNIGIDIRSLLGGRYSGVGIYTDQLLSSLFQRQDSHQYFLFSNSFQRSMESPRFPAFQNVTSAFFHLPNKLLNTSLVFFGRPYIDQIMRSKTSSEGSIIPSIDLFFLPNWLFFACSPRCRFVLTLHDLSIFRTPECYSMKQKLWHRALRIKSLTQRADAIICVSSHTARDAEDLLHIPAQKLHVIPEGVSSSFYPITDKTIRETARRKYRLPASFALFMGNIEPRKNIEGMLLAFEAWKKLSRDDEMHFVLAGPQGWSPRYARKILLRVQSSPFASFLHLIGYIDPQDKPAVLSMTSVFLFVSFYEGFGLPVLEAMACGAPVITSAVSSLPEVCGNAAILVDPDNINDIASALKQALSSVSLRQILGAQGQIQAQKFTWELAAQKTLAVFNKV